MYKFKNNHNPNKSLLIPIFSLLLMSLLGLLFYPRYRITAYDNSKIIAKNKPALSNKPEPSNNTLSAEKNKNIKYEENTLFRKYTINFNNIVNKSQLIDLGDSININFNNSDIDSSILKDNTSIIGIDILNLNPEKSVIKIKKLFKEENKIYIDNNNNKKLIILIGKVKNPYKYKVVLDPGHGGRDPGDINGKLTEKDITPKICYYIYNYLMFNGCQVILTRETDIELDKLIKKDLIKRAKIANDNKADIFISIHLNSGNVKDKNFKNYKGVSTYYFANKYKSQNNQGLKLAQTIQKNVVESDGWINRIILPADYSVLRNTVMPSALVECGFLTNSDDIIRLKNEIILNNLGTNIGKGIMEYIINKKS